MQNVSDKSHNSSTISSVDTVKLNERLDSVDSIAMFADCATSVASGTSVESFKSRFNARATPPFSNPSHKTPAVPMGWPDKCTRKSPNDMFRTKLTPSFASCVASGDASSLSVSTFAKRPVASAVSFKSPSHRCHLEYSTSFVNRNSHVLFVPAARDLGTLAS